MQGLFIFCQHLSELLHLRESHGCLFNFVCCLWSCVLRPQKGLHRLLIESSSVMIFSFVGSGLSHESHRRDVEQVYLRCSQGSLEWLYPTGAIIVNLRPNTEISSRHTVGVHVCIKPQPYSQVNEEINLCQSAKCR